MARQFTRDAAHRIVRATAEVERGLRGQRQHRGRWQGYPYGYSVWLTELLEDLPEGVCNQPVLARRRFWDATLCSGKGAFATSADASDNCYVADYREVGYCGPEGALGAAEYRNPGTSGMPRHYNDGVNGSFPFLTLCDLACPPGQEVDCSDYEAEGSGS